MFDVDADVFTLYNEIVQKKKYRGFSMLLDTSSIRYCLKVDRTIACNSADPFQDLVDIIDDESARYLAFEAIGEGTDGAFLKKMVFVHWVGPQCTQRQKIASYGANDQVMELFDVVIGYCEGQKDVTRPWILDAVNRPIYATFYGKDVFKDGISGLYYYD